MAVDPQDYLAGVGGRLSGRVGVRVYSHNAWGPYSFPFPVRQDPNTTYQQAVRSDLTNASKAWRGEGSAYRADWDTYAANVPHVNRLGQTVYLTGYLRHMAASALRHSIGYLFPAYAPEVFTLAGHGGTLIRQVRGDLTRVLFFFNLGDYWRHHRQGVILIQQSPPQLTTRNYYNGHFRRFAGATGDPFVPPVSRRFLLLWPATPTHLRIFFRTRVIDQDNRVSRSITQHLDYVP